MRINKKLRKPQLSFHQHTSMLHIETKCASQDLLNMILTSHNCKRRQRCVYVHKSDSCSLVCLLHFQHSAVLPCPLAWSGESSRVRATPSISAVQGATSSWLRQQTTAAPTTRSVMLTLSRWKMSTATSPTPTKSYRKGKDSLSCPALLRPEMWTSFPAEAMDPDKVFSSCLYSYGFTEHRGVAISQKGSLIICPWCWRITTYSKLI